MIKCLWLFKPQSAWTLIPKQNSQIFCLWSWEPLSRFWIMNDALFHRVEAAWSPSTDSMWSSDSQQCQQGCPQGTASPAFYNYNRKSFIQSCRRDQGFWLQANNLNSKRHNVKQCLPLRRKTGFLQKWWKDPECDFGIDFSWRKMGGIVIFFRVLLIYLKKAIL